MPSFEIEKLEEDFDAVFIGVGAQVGKSLPIKGASESPHTTNAIDFLRNYEILGIFQNSSDS